MSSIKSLFYHQFRRKLQRRIFPFLALVLLIFLAIYEINLRWNEKINHRIFNEKISMHISNIAETLR